MQKILVLILLLSGLPFIAYSQYLPAAEKDTLVKNIIDQIVIFPKEKIYVQTDKQFYISGEKIWFRAYLVDAVIHKPVSLQYVFVELVSPSDSVVCRVKIRQNLGVFSGYIPVRLRLPEGDYTLSAWSDNMVNLDPGYYFRKKIHISNLPSSDIGIKTRIKLEKTSMLSAELSFEDRESHRVIRPDGLRISVNNIQLNQSSIRPYDALYFSFRPPSDTRNNAILVETKNCSKYIPFTIPDSDFDVTFYPEGGYLPEGSRCKIAFKAMRPDGAFENITGRIFDKSGKEYVSVSAFHDGMGSFYLIADSTSKFYGVFKNEAGREKRFDLPVTHKAAYSLKAETSGSSLILSVLHSSDIKESEDLFLVMHTRGIVHYASMWDNNFTSISFDTRKFPDGVMQIILFDSKLSPLSERLIFCDNNDQTVTEIRTDQQNYSAREKVSVNTKITDSRGVPLKGSFSVSVTDDNDVRPDSAINILSDLLLSSELKGYINNPSYYFRDKSQETLKALDLLMLTNGWRRYNIPAIARRNFERPSKPAKYGMQISGNVRKLIPDKPADKGRVAVFCWASGYYDDTETKTDGSFCFNGIEYQDSLKFIVQALNKKGNARVELFLNTDSFPIVRGLPNFAGSSGVSAAEEKKLGTYLAKADVKLQIENGSRVINLPEVIVTAKAKESEDYNYSYYMPQTSSDVLTNDKLSQYHFSRLSEIMNQFPGVRTQEDENNKLKVIIERMSLRMTGQQYNFAALIIDDMRIDDYDLDTEIDPSDIERVGILKGGAASILGGEGSGGAVVITTKRGEFVKDNTPRFNIKILNPLGYQKPAEFYSPKYDTPEKKKVWNPDLRSTIYWNPSVNTETNGVASFDFYTADTPSIYTMVIEGITFEGAIIRSVKKISRR